MLSLYALFAGFVLDLIVGDPIGWPHIVLGYGKLIAFSERALRRAFPKTKTGELLAGGALVIIMCAVGYLAGAGILRLAALLSPWLRFAVETILVWQCLSARSLKTASLKVHSALSRDITLARAAVGEIVGRDTDALDESGVVRATVETVAENTCDGVVAPLLFLAVGGAPLGMLYKAASTMDSMVGYKNERYLYFGRVAARLDDVLNFIPARLGGLFMIAAACLTGLDGKGAWRVFRRDRLNHKSPNSAHTESACAGALGITLGGASVYGGVLVEKPTIGDGKRPAERDDILKSNRLLRATALLFWAACLLVKGAIVWL
jgi:adenosylcobinamide-phosphate synthase